MGSSHQPKFIKEIYHWDFIMNPTIFFGIRPPEFPPADSTAGCGMSGAPLKMRIERRLAAMQENYPEFIYRTYIWVICIRWVYR